jgi:E3 SUMO-protein ligase PIAS1
MASTPSMPLDPEPYVRLVRNSGMLNRTLQSICTGEGLNKNGVKAELQQRIIDSTCTEKWRALSDIWTHSLSIINTYWRRLIFISFLGIRRHAAQGDVTMFNRLKALIENPNSLSQPASQYNSLPNSMSPAAASTPSSYLGVSSNSGYNMAAGGINNYRVSGIGGHRSEFRFSGKPCHVLNIAGIEFKGSPFYVIQQQLGEMEECQGRHRPQ